MAFLEGRRVDFLALLPRMEAEGFWENVLMPYIIGVFFAGPGILARVVLAAALGDPLWPSFTHPIMAAVWAGITCRSLFQRIVLRRLTWRGREFDARGARF